MANLTTFRTSKTHRTIIFGAPKSGKTQMVGELSKQFNLLWFDLENGFETLLKLPRIQQERINLIRLPDSKTYPIAIETMLKVITGYVTNICDAHGKVSCSLCKRDSLAFSEVCLNTIPEDTIVVVDSLTQLANSAMNHITKNQGDEYKVEWEDYRKQGSLMDKFLSQVQQARYNICCITHEAEVEMEDGRKKLVPVAGTTNFSRNTAKYFDDVIYSEVKNRAHKFGSSTTYSNNILTGSRTDIELEKSDSPSLLSIFKRNGGEARGVRESVSDAGRDTDVKNTILGEVDSENKGKEVEKESQIPAETATKNLSEMLAKLKKGK